MRYGAEWRRTHDKREPPPYFPTTDRFSKGQYYQVDPTTFNVAAYFKMLTPKN